MKPYEIKGHTIAKRAFEVAAVADSGVLLIGPIGTGKTTVRAAFPNVRSDERESCLCGHYGDVTTDCICTSVQIARWMRRIERTARNYDVVIEMCAVPARELMARPEPDAHLQDKYRAARIAAAREFGKIHTSVSLEADSAFRLMEMATRRLQFTAGQYESVLRVARATASLDRSSKLQAKHLAEAVQYQSLVAMWRRDIPERMTRAGETKTI